MDVRHLRYFIAIVDSGSLSQASRRLHIVQPALSQRLADLEAELGVQLLVRGRSGVAVTDAGAELYERARIIVKQMEATKIAVQEKAGVAHGPVAIGLLRSVAPMVGAKLFQTIKIELPEVTPDIVVGYSVELMNKLRATRLDIAMHILRKTDRDVPPLFSERFCVVGDKKFLGKGVTRLKLADLAGLPLLLTSMQRSQSSLIDVALTAQVTLNIIGGIEDPGSVLDVCSTGGAVTLLPESSAAVAVSRRRLKMAVLDEPTLVRSVALASNPDVPKTGAVMAVETILIRLLTEFAAAHRA